MDALQLEGLELEFIEDAEGRWQLSGLGQTQSDGDGLDKALERLFDQRRITLLDSSIRISPWEQPDWEFTNGDLTLINRGSRHRLDARLSLPDQQVVSLQLEGKLPGRDWRRAACASSSTCRPATGSVGFRKNSSGSCMSPGWRPVVSSGAASTGAVWAASAGSCRRLWWPWTCPVRRRRSRMCSCSSR